mmetsp:Transcript_35161/g.101240  ORF Transcript_35161/g.101240 Transcript_35161/m.101240 type:complete len:230 (-) Transcript_35161:2601-3290(-)
MRQVVQQRVNFMQCHLKLTLVTRVFLKPYWIPELAGNVPGRVDVYDVLDVAPQPAVDLKDRVLIELTIRMVGLHAGLAREGRNGRLVASHTQTLHFLAAAGEPGEESTTRRPARASASDSVGTARGSAWRARRRSAQPCDIEADLRPLGTDLVHKLALLVQVDADLPHGEGQVHAARALEGVEGRAHLHEQEVFRMEAALHTDAGGLRRQPLHHAVRAPAVRRRAEETV